MEGQLGPKICGESQALTTRFKRGRGDGEKNGACHSSDRGCGESMLNYNNLQNGFLLRAKMPLPRP
jgi:hypothetical protein